MVVHSIAICNYNMSRTVEPSLRSILDQIDETFEVVVIDDGSDDGSLEILRSLEAEYDRLRVESLPYDPDRNLGKTRNISFQQSRGEYVLESLDTDDRYDEGIRDFVNVYHQIESQVDFEFYLKGRSINMAPRNLLLDISYRNFGRGQDRDLWRRLFANDAIIWLDHEVFSESIGYDDSLFDQISISYGMKITDFRSGVSYPSFLRWSWGTFGIGRFLYHLAITPSAYIEARQKGRYEAPPSFDRMGALKDTIEANSMTLSEIETAYGVEIDRDRLTKAGKEIFFPDEYQ